MVLLAYFLGIAMADEVDGLIKQLTSNNPQKRLAAAKALGEKKILAQLILWLQL